MKNTKSPDCVMQALQLFDAVGDGDKDGYRAALRQAAKLVRDPLKQLAMVDCILAARKRAYKEAA